MGPLAFALVNNPLQPLTIPLSQILFMKMMVDMKTTFFTSVGLEKEKQATSWPLKYDQIDPSKGLLKEPFYTICTPS